MRGGSASLGREIYENYIKQDAPLELNIPQAARNEIRAGAEKAGQMATQQLGMVFKQATNEVLKMMAEYWDEFVGSEQAQKMKDDILEREAKEAKEDADPPTAEWWLRKPTRAEKNIKDKYLATGEAAENFAKVDKKKKPKKKKPSQRGDDEKFTLADL